MLMRMRMLFLSLVTLSTLFLVACSKDGNDEKVSVKVEGRWYTNVQVSDGKKVFKSNCAACHGSEGQGLVKNWKKPLPDGKYPAPPLNGSAHAWHHSKDQLLRTINSGGIPLGGTMPAFKDKLSAKEKDAVLAYFMSLWPDRIYQTWEKRNPS